MPAVTIKLERTKHDMRKGKNTGSPVSIVNVRCRTADSAELDAIQRTGMKC